MAKERITKEMLADRLSALPLGEGLEAKFYRKQGAVVVTFEHLENGKTYRVGRNSWERHAITDIDTLWDALATEHHLEPPCKKSLTEIILPETRQKLRKEHSAKMTGKERKRMVLERLAQMESYTRKDVVRLYMQAVGEEQKLQPFDGDKKQRRKMVSSLQEAVFFSDEVDGGCIIKWERMGERTRKSAGYVPQYYLVTSVEPNAMTRAEKRTENEKMKRIMSKDNYGVFDSYRPVNEGRLKAELQNRERIKDYDERKDTFCHGIGQRRTKLFLNRLAKQGDQTARMYRIALEIEGVNLAAKKALMKYHSDYHSYDKKEAMLRELMDVCRADGVTYGQQRSTAPAATHVIYFDLPGCEQISFHTNMSDAASIPAYDGAWDGKKCSTLGKLESAIWQRYENELKAKYNV